MLEFYLDDDKSAHFNGQKFLIQILRINSKKPTRKFTIYFKSKYLFDLTFTLNFLHSWIIINQCFNFDL